MAMNRTVESKNKALVLEAFDTLFNKHDYAARCGVHRIRGSGGCYKWHRGFCALAGA
jgi:hypothetical protein